MLVLSRKTNEKILLPGLDVAVQVVSISKGAVRLGIQAPPQIAVLREELSVRQREWNKEPVAPPEPPSDRLCQLLSARLKVANAGLGQLRRQIADARYDEMVDTIERLEEDLQLLQKRVDQEAARPNGRRQRALLVEDNENERELLASLLRREGMEVATAGDGTDALDYLSHHRGEPDVLLLDMGLPRCDGASVVRMVRNDPSYSGLKIFAVTGHLPEEYQLDRGPRGVDRWFHKPVNPLELVQALAPATVAHVSPVPGTHH